MQISRAAVRKFVEDHVRRQFQAEANGHWHQTQLDLNDELNDAIFQVRQDAGDAAAERFHRLYVEEAQAIERDILLSKGVAARRYAGGEVRPQRPSASQAPQVMMIEGPKLSPGPGFWVFCILIGGALAFLL